MELKPKILHLFNSSQSSNLVKTISPATVTTTDPYPSPQSSKPRSSSHRKTRPQIPVDSENFQIKDLPTFVNRTATSFQNLLASPSYFQPYSTTHKEFEIPESPHNKLSDGQDTFLRPSGRSLERLSRLPPAGPSEKENFILLRKDIQTPKTPTSEMFQSSQAFSGHTGSGIFLSKMFPMTDLKGRLNLKFFLKSSLRSSGMMEFRPNQTGFSPSMNLQRQTSMEAVSSSNQHSEGVTTKLNRPRRVPSQNIIPISDHNNSKAQKEDKTWGAQKVIIQKKMPCVRLSVTPSRVLTRNGPRHLVDENTNEETKILDECEVMDDLLKIIMKKKGDHFQRYQDRYEKTNEKLERSSDATRKSISKTFRRKINFSRGNPNFIRAEVSPKGHRGSNLLNPMFFGQPSLEIKKIQKHNDAINDLNGYTEWEAFTNSERQDLFDLKACQGLSTGEQDTIKKKRKVVKRREKTERKSFSKDSRVVVPKKVEEYRNFIMGLNFSFNIVIKQDKDKYQGMYKYYLGKGNNHELIRTLMKQRWWWTQIDSKSSSDLNFMWTQLKNYKFIKSLKSKKKTSVHSGKGSPKGASSGEKESLITNMDSITIYDNTEMNSKDSLGSQLDNDDKKKTKIITKKKQVEKKETSNLKRIFTDNEIELIDAYTLLHNTSQKTLGLEEWEKLCRMRKGPTIQVINDPNSLKMCNHLEDNFHLANKKALLWNMRNYYEALKEEVFQHLPLTFHVKAGLDDSEFKKFAEYYRLRENEVQEEAKCVQDPKSRKVKNIWIVKPGEETNRGIGIYVCNELRQIQELVCSVKKIEGTEINHTYLIQQYIDKPFLYNKRKFDLRCYTLLSCMNGSMKGYWYQGGYIRTSSKEFSVKNLANKQVHLTNNSVQKKAEDYGKFESGNKLTFTDFQKYLEQTYHGAINFDTHIYPKIRKLSIDTIRGVFDRIDPHRRENCFEIFGLDFMIDTDLKVWLIEVNTNPDITTDSPVLSKIIPGMVDNALRLTLDQMYPPPIVSTKRQALPENLLENNRFEIVFDEIEEGEELAKTLNKNTKPLDIVFDVEVQEQDSIEDTKE